MSIHDKFKAAVVPLFGSQLLGVEITYVPDASLGIDPFPCVGIPGRIDKDDTFIQGALDSAGIKILHATFAAAGMPAPVPRGDGHAGDQLMMKNINGVEEAWTVTDADPSAAGYWVLSLERNQKLTPQ